MPTDPAPLNGIETRACVSCGESTTQTAYLDVETRAPVCEWCWESMQKHAEPYQGDLP